MQLFQPHSKISITQSKKKKNKSKCFDVLKTELKKIYESAMNV